MTTETRAPRTSSASGTGTSTRSAAPDGGPWSAHQDRGGERREDQDRGAGPGGCREAGHEGIRAGRKRMRREVRRGRGGCDGVQDGGPERAADLLRDRK